MPGTGFRRLAGAACAFAVVAAVLAAPSAAGPSGSPGGRGTTAAPGPAGSLAVAGRARAATADVVLNPDTGRRELLVPHPADIAVLVGDSQADGAAGVPGNRTWPQVALRAAGYTVAFRGRGGTGYATGNGFDPDYVTALRQERWLLPHGDVGLVVIEGGGNDARSGASDAAITAAQATLVAELRSSYPRSRVVVIGTLARSAADDGGRRHDVDALLGQGARALGVDFISAGNWLTAHGLAAHLADGAHLDAEGHRLASEVLLRALRDHGLVRGTTAAAR